MVRGGWCGHEWLSLSIKDGRCSMISASLVDWRATRNLHVNALQRIRCTTCLTNPLGRG